ncbi:hypothetical protein OAA60_03075 [Porticoccaceae bacterium]|nr:hypothetical protein [Porticoccaceae bacterium]
MSNISDFSTTASSNNSASPDGFPEGMAPSGLNDSARELMAAVAKQYQDTDGGLVTTGTGTAYVLATNSSHATLASQGIMAFRINTINTGSATLNVDTLGAKTMKMGGANLVAGALPQDSIVVAVYNATNDVYDVLTHSAVLSGELLTAAQPNITSVGTLTALTVDNITVNGAAITSDTGAISFSNENLTTTGTAATGALTVTGDSTLNGDIHFSNASPEIFGNDVDGFLRLTGGDATGARLMLLGASHPTAANDIIFYQSSNEVLRYDNSALTWDFISRNITTTGTAATGALTVTGAVKASGDTIIGSTSVTPDGTLHVHSGSAGAVAAGTGADDLVVETSGTGGVSILVPNSAAANLYFGNLAGNRRANLVWDNSSSAFIAASRVVGATTVLRADNNVTNLTLSGASGSELATFAGDVTVGTGTLLVGGTSQEEINGVTADLQMVGTGNADSAFHISRYSADASGTVMRLFKSRNASAGGNTIITTGDTLFSMQFYGDDGVDNFTQSANINCVSEGTVGVGRIPSKLEFLTGTDATSTVPTLALTLDSSQNAIFAGEVDAADTITSGGTRLLPGLSTTTSVTAGPTTIFSVASGQPLCIVSGNAAGGNIFLDLVAYTPAGGFVVISSSSVNASPAARTYSVSGANLQLSMASGTYTVGVASITGSF